MSCASVACGSHSVPARRGVYIILVVTEILPRASGVSRQRTRATEQDYSLVERPGNGVVVLYA